MKRIILIFFAVFFMVGCQSQEQLSNTFDQEKIDAQNLAVIDALNAKDAQTLTDLSNDTMKEALPAEKWEEVFTLLDNVGPFKEIKESVSSSTEENGAENAVSVIKAAYEKADVTYTISFDTDYQLSGIYLK